MHVKCKLKEAKCIAFTCSNFTLIPVILVAVGK